MITILECFHLAAFSRSGQNEWHLSAHLFCSLVPDPEDVQACAEACRTSLLPRWPSSHPSILPASSPESLFIIIKLHSWQPIKQDILFLTTCSPPPPSSALFYAINLSALPKPLKAFWLLYNAGGDSEGSGGRCWTVCFGAVMPQHSGGERGKGTGRGGGVKGHGGSLCAAWLE